MSIEIEKLKKQLESVSGTDRVDVLIKLASAYNNQSATTALEYSKEALHLAREIGYRQGEALALSGIGSIHYMLADFTEALPQYQQALLIEKELKNTTTVANLVFTIGIIHDKMGTYEKAIECNMEAMELLKGSDNKDSMSRTLNKLGLCYRKLDDYEKAMRGTSKRYTINEEGGVYKGSPPQEKDVESTNSSILVPLKIDNETVGVIQVQSYRLDAYGQDDIDLLSSLALLC